MSQPNTTFRVRTDGRSGEYVILDIVRDEQVLGMWRLLPEDAARIASELSQAAGKLLYGSVVEQPKLLSHTPTCPGVCDCLVCAGACKCGYIIP